MRTQCAQNISMMADIERTIRDRCLSLCSRFPEWAPVVTSPPITPAHTGSRSPKPFRRIEAAVGLKFKTPPRVEARSKEQVRDFVTSQFRDPQSLREFNGIEAAYKRLGMVPDTLDLKKFLVDLLAEQIIGYYDPKTKVLVRRQRLRAGSGVDHDHARAGARASGSVHQPRLDAEGRRAERPAVSGAGGVRGSGGLRADRGDARRRTTSP